MKAEKTEIKEISTTMGVKLELTLDEAMVLRKLLGCVGGGGKIREVIDRIYAGMSEILPPCSYKSLFDETPVLRLYKTVKDCY